MEGIQSERQFEEMIRFLIKEKIISRSPNLLLLTNKKAVDIIVCRNGEKPKIFFIEIKYNKDSHGRLGFGQEKGKGFQPEILTHRPHFFEEQLRWILATEGNDGYFFIDTPSLLGFIQGGEIGLKHNGIRRTLFKELPSVNEPILIDQLIAWFNS